MNERERVTGNLVSHVGSHVDTDAGTDTGASGAAREELELKLLLEAVFSRYGYDFRDYASASMRRRISNRVRAEKLESVAALQERVLQDPACMERLLVAMTVHVTAMFRDPGFYRAFREKVIPVLQTYPFVRIWHAGCSTGEEVYSLAILLHEEGIYKKCRIYATDLSEAVLQTAKAGLFPLRSMKDNTENYQQAQGKAEFSQYYTAQHGQASFREGLRENVVFAPHNLVTDGSFNEFNVILCRNVMIYFNRSLQDQVHGLFYKSLCRFGILGLGKRESMRFTPEEASYQALDGPERLFRKIA
jgi:chemotaxis protein methyltransferase CheR